MDLICCTALASLLYQKKKRAMLTFFVDCGLRGGREGVHHRVVRWRCSDVVRWRWLGLWGFGRKEKRQREKAGAARERKAAAGAPRTRRRRKTLVQTTVLHTQKYCSTIKTMVLNTYFFKVAAKHHSVKYTMVFSNTTVLL
jgi:hypothetical protein